MRIGVSGWRLSGQALGVSRYTEYLLKNWQGMLGPADDLTLFVSAPLSDARTAAFGRATVKEIRPRLTNALWENLLLPRHATGIDVMFGPSYTLPLTYSGRSVVAIHSADEAGKRVPDWRRVTFELKYKLSARKADRVIVNANTVKQGVVESYGIPASKVDVVWLAADGAFRPLDDPDLMRATRIKFLGADRPYIVFVGGLSARRNVPMLLRAFSILKSTDKIPHALLLVGPNRGNVPLEQLVSELRIGDSVVQTDGRFADHRELVAVYNAADVYVNPSSSDGFSLTLIEAMSCGTPVITINGSALGEVAHGHAVTLETPELDALTHALRQVLGNPDFRRSVGRRCLERSRDFSWDKTARQTLDVLRAVANQ